MNLLFSFLAGKADVAETNICFLKIIKSIKAHFRFHADIGAHASVVGTQKVKNIFLILKEKSELAPLPKRSSFANWTYDSLHLVRIYMTTPSRFSTSTRYRMLQRKQGYTSCSRFSRFASFEC